MEISSRIRYAVILLAVSGAFFARPIFSQPQNATFSNITPADGLPSTSMRSVTQDAFGFIWVGTWDYVYRYDGQSFKKIRGSEGGRIVHGDSKGGVWITYSGSVGYYDPHKDSMTPYTIPNVVRYGELTTDAVNNVWVLSSDGVVTLDTLTNHFIKDPGQRPGRLLNLSAWGNGQLLFVVWSDNSPPLIGRRTSKGIYSYEELPIDVNNQENKGVRFGPGGFQTHPMDSTGILLLNRYGWAYKKWNETDWTYRKPLHNELEERPNDLKLDGTGNFWFTQPNALTKINIETAQSTVYAHNPTNPRSILPMNSRRHLYIDKQGVLWTAHFGYGISMLNLYDSDFGLLKDSTNAPVLDVLSAVELTDGSYWIGSRDQENPTRGLIHYRADGKVIKRYGSKSHDAPPGTTLSSELSNPYAQSLAVSGDGSVWVGTGSIGKGYGGLNRIRPGSDQITRFKNDPNDKSSLTVAWTSRLLVDGSDRVWVFSGASMWTTDKLGAGQLNALSIIDPATEKIITEFHIQPTDSIQRTIYQPHMVTSSGDIIVSMDRYTYFIIDHQSLKAKPFARETTSADSMIITHQDAAGKIWFSSRKGFGYLNSTFTAVDRFFDFDKLNIPIDESPALFTDKQGNIWLATDNGIIAFEPATQTYKRFGFERGLQGNLFLFDSYQGPSGKMYFMGTGGINIFDPEGIRTNPYPPQMAFTDLKLDGKSIVFGKTNAIQKPIFIADKITVGPETDVIAIDFAALHFAGKVNQYKYKLDGFDKDWRDGGTVGNATYTNLPPGGYTLFIKGSNLDNVWSDGNKSIAITILPPWWRTWWAYAGYGLIFLFTLRRVHLYQKTITLRKERERAQHKELEQAKEIEKAYTELKVTQSQLIQSEKMASLGELTAGIAHEIQNPLNFVNNFSEVSNELIDEMKSHLASGNWQPATEIASDLKQNLEKINHHGKRADAIVKGMLQHSRTSSGKKELTDINALCDEYLRLAYHGLRAKDKSFNAKFETKLDPTLPKVNVVPQEIGRVVLNLINNAFYATSEKRKAKSEKPGSTFEPTVIVSTKRVGSPLGLPAEASAKAGAGGAGGKANTIEITVTDNGSGIPAHIKEKIFQPFFTTKPTGQGTGLGLSLSYDIVKAHGGELKVVTKEGEGSEFIVQLPIV